MVTVLQPSVAENALEDVHIQYGDVKITLPNLQDSGRLPIVLLQAGVIASGGWERLTSDQQTDVMASFLAYFMRDYPQLVAEIDRKSGDKIKDFERIVQAWAEGSKTDPKVSSLLTSGTASAPLSNMIG
ncbi:hypothetical protein [Alloscardovia macacae]|uniref:Uncharacterized protein n=1 Tax=Alloscardovia macacae TaxID=1160091 RepID=A0A261F503_9BIFI|nr:hypothetical protein [Alloscardovia macacae]OZG54123.1 hypothetical protein ALMA_0584 [Alloscardovia macacae]